LHFRLLVLFFLTISLFGRASETTNKILIDNFLVQDTLSTKDSLKKPEKKSPFTDPIFSNANDSMIYSLDGKKVFLYGNAVVTYQNIELKAQYIEFDMENKEVFAKGLPDSTGKNVGRPIFKEGGNTYNMEDIYYNFGSKKAKIKGVVTEQDGGFMHGEETKMMPDKCVNISNGKFTTCDQLHPHFYIAITKGKVIPNDKIISGPAYLVIEDVPMPIGIPFGFFPNTRKRANGIILPEYGEEVRRGVYLRGGGYYFGINDNMDMKITGDVYSFGSWLLRNQSSYKKRYKYSGSFNIDYSIIKTDADTITSYNIAWTHSQDPKANPNSTFSANVNFGSTNHNRYNAQSIDAFHNNTINSSISYSKNFVGTPFRLNTSFTHSQNNQTKIVNVNFPRVAFSMDKIYPLKNESNTSSALWYEKIGFSLNTSLDNKVTVKESELFKKGIVDKMSNGIKHEIPLSTSFNLLKYVIVSPSVSYSEYWYAKTIRKNWSQTEKKVIEDTIPGFRRAYQYSTSASMSTTIYGMFNFGKDKAIQAIRHKITPTFSISYRPDFSEPQYGFFKTVKTDTAGHTQKYSIFERGVYGGPGAGKSGVISFGLGNNLEMKVRSSKDTISGFKKIKIFESLSFSSGYNLLADSMNLQNITFNGNTRLFDKVGISFGGLLNPYALNTAKSREINKFEFNETGKLARLTSFNFGLDFSLNSSKNDKPNNQLNVVDKTNINPDDTQFGQSMSSNYNQQVDFNVPWNLRVNYAFNYSKPYDTKTISQTLGFGGDLSLTPKWKIGFQSNYDFKSRKLSTTSLNISRDLHCWVMNITIIPIGIYKSYSFQINVKSGMLQDLKWKKRDSYLDNQASSAY